MANETSLFKNKFEVANEARKARAQKPAEPPTPVEQKPSELDAFNAETKQMRDAIKAEKEARKKPQQTVVLSNPLSQEEEFYLARRWADSNYDWYASDYNIQQLKAIVEYFDLPHTYDGFQQAFVYGVNNNHFEFPAVRKRGSLVRREAPRPFVPPTQVAEPVRSGSAPVYIKSNEDEIREARKLSDEELKKQARSQMRAFNANKDK